MKTEKRIKKLSEAVKNLFENFNRRVVVADIATDHGYLAEELSKEEKIEKVIATDISEKSLSKLIKLMDEKKIKNIKPIVGDGLMPIDKVDIAVIAGIGAYEIMKMIQFQNRTKQGEVKSRYFVLQPAQNIVQLREWIYNSKFKVLQDIIINDGKQFYPIVVIDVLKKEYTFQTIKNLWLGKFVNNADEDFNLYLNELYENLKFINDLPQKRVKNDKILRQKRKLLKITENLLQKQ